VRHKINRKISALFIGLVVGLGSAPVEAGDPIDATMKFIERTKEAMMGAEVHRLSLYSTVQNYQVNRRRSMRSMLITLEVTGDEAMVFVCKNQPRLREAVLRAVTAFYRASRGTQEISEKEVARRARTLFGDYLKKDWLLKVDARFVPSASDAGPEVLKTQTKCKAVAS